MKDFAKKLLKMLFNKTVLVYLLGALTGAAGVQIPAETIGAVVCTVAPSLSGCGVEQAPIVEQVTESK